MEKIKLKINGQEVEGKMGETIMSVALKNKINILGVCYCPDLKPESSCRLCLVSIVNRKGFFTSCNTKIEQGMEVITDSPEIEKIKRINFELIFLKHAQNCFSCRRKKYCKLLKIARVYGFDLKSIKKTRLLEKYQFGPSIIFDPNKCINCNNCVQVCHNQGVGFLETKKVDGFSRVTPSCNSKDCIYCGQCLSHCPSGAFEEVSSIPNVEQILADKQNYVVFQFSSVMVKSLKGELGNDWDINFLSKALKKMGAKMIFDTSFGVDVVIEEESKDLIHRLGEKNKQCLFTSHCPAWVKFIEFYYPEFIPSLSNNRSPHMIWGGHIKNYLIKQGIDPAKIFIISIAPCTSKKYEVLRPELEIGGIRPVDAILTTNEVCLLLRKLNYNLGEIEKENLKNVFIKNKDAYGSNEDIIKSGLKAFYKKKTGKELNGQEFKKIEGVENGIESDVLIDGKLVKVAVVYGLLGAKKILEILKNNPNAYDYLEVMACPRGCLGGGGQPIYDDASIDDCLIEKDMNGYFDVVQIEKIIDAGLEKRKEICKTEYSKAIKNNKKAPTDR